MLSRFNMSECHSKLLPFDSAAANIKQSDYNLVTNPKLYQEIVGSLIYIMTCTRPDLSFVVTKLPQYMSNPTSAHLNIAKNVLKYLKGTIDYSLKFSKSDTEMRLFGYCDSDWGSSEERKSISGFCFHMNDNGPLVSWKIKKQNIVALSSCEAEYVAMTVAVQEAKFLRQLLFDLTASKCGSVTLFAENQSAIKLSKLQYFINALSIWTLNFISLDLRYRIKPLLLIIYPVQIILPICLQNLHQEIH